jgi:hypothetical protein
MTRTEAEAEALRRAREIREEMQQTRQVFLREEFTDRVRHACRDLGTPAVDGLAAWTAATVDREYLEKYDRRTGLFGDLDGDLDLGDGWRIRVGYARKAHMERMLRGMEGYEAIARADYEEAVKRYRRV